MNANETGMREVTAEEMQTVEGGDALMDWAISCVISKATVDVVRNCAGAVVRAAGMLI